MLRGNSCYYLILECYSCIRVDKTIRAVGHFEFYLSLE